MSHKPVTPSAPGTPLADQTVGEIVAANPNLSRVFQAHNIGFCCQGKLSLRRACERNEVDLATMLADLEKETAGASLPNSHPTELGLSDLADFIVEHHHGYLRRELPRLHAMAERVAQVHGKHTPTLVDICQIFTRMGQELAAHAKKEEEVLFPAIRKLEESDTHIAHGFEASVTEMMQEHESTATAISHLRALSNNYQPPADACNTYRALFAGLADFEANTARHIHLENDCLFPRILQMAS